MRAMLVASLIGLSATSVDARADGNIPMVVIGMPFQPETPRPIAATHPLYHLIDVTEIEGLPTVVGSSALNFIAAAKRSSVNKALRETFERMQLLSEPSGTPRFRLTVKWLGSETPFLIATHNTATVSLHYKLARVDTGLVLFERDIKTSVDGGGADASMRDNGIVRAAIGANFASAANCLDHAAFGTAPYDCALVPQFKVSVVRRSLFP